jgi:hypothetical protein
MPVRIFVRMLLSAEQLAMFGGREISVRPYVGRTKTGRLRAVAGHRRKLGPPLTRPELQAYWAVSGGGPEGLDQDELQEDLGRDWADLADGLVAKDRAEWHEDRLRLTRYGETAQEEPLHFVSGASRVPHIRGLGSVGYPVGVVPDEVSANAEQALYRAPRGLQIFVDSGAFSEFSVGPEGPQWDPAKEPKWAEVFDLYDRLATHRPPEELHVVAPDKIADQRATLERQKQWGPRVRALAQKGVNVLVPVQKGSESMADFYRAELRTLGLESATPAARWIPSIPMKSDATSLDDLEAFLDDVRPARIHLLGMGPESPKADQVLALVERVSPGTRVQMDSASIGAKVGEGRPMTAVRRELGAQFRPAAELAEAEIYQTTGAGALRMAHRRGPETRREGVGSFEGRAPGMERRPRRVDGLGPGAEGPRRARRGIPGLVA